MERGYENLTPEKAAELIRSGKCFVVDVRTPEEFDLHRISGAHLLPVQELRERHAEIPRASNRPILIYCEHGIRSVNVCRLLAENGWANLLNMSGGMAAWIECGLPIASGKSHEDPVLRPPAGPATE